MSNSTTKETLSLPPSPQTPGLAVFINKVWSILANDEYKKLISWSESGKNVIVHDYPNFAKDVLPRYFKHNNFNSFVRQLNLYGFRKVSHPEQGVLLKVQVNEPIEFWHPNFQQGHPELLHLVQRRPVATRVSSSAEEKPSELTRVLTDIHTMKGKQENIGDMLEAMRQDNVHLKQELEVLKERYTRQQKVLNKIIQFLVHMVYKRRLPTPARRRPEPKRYLMLTGSDGAAPSAKRGRVSLDPSPPSISYSTDSPLSYSDIAELQLPIATNLEPNSPLALPTITSPPPPPLPPSSLDNMTTIDPQYMFEPAQGQTPVPSSLPPTLNTPPIPATTNAIATLTSSPPTLSSSSFSSLIATANSLVPALPDSSSSIVARPSAASSSSSSEAFAELSSPTVYPDWSNLTDHLDSHQQELDSLHDFLSNQLSFDPSMFISLKEGSVPEYDAMDTANLLDVLSMEHDREMGAMTEASKQTALVPVQAKSEVASLSPCLSGDHNQFEEEQSSSIRELLQLNQPTDTNTTTNTIQ